MSLILENARLTNDTSQQTCSITIADGVVKSIVPTSNDSAASSGYEQAERIDVKGNYVGECKLFSGYQVDSLSRCVYAELPLASPSTNLTNLCQPQAWSTTMSTSASGHERVPVFPCQSATPSPPLYKHCKKPYRNAMHPRPKTH